MIWYVISSNQFIHKILGKGALFNATSKDIIKDNFRKEVQTPNTVGFFCLFVLCVPLREYKKIY